MVIRQQKQLKILLIGDACTDVYVFGECNRISPEAPVPVFTKNRKDYRCGMSANVYENLKNIFSGTICYLSSDKTKTKKIRFIDEKSNYQIMRYDIEKEILPLSLTSLPKENFDAIIISDYNKGFVTDDIIKNTRALYTCPIFVDTKKKDISIFSNCILKINEKEHDFSYNVPDTIELIVTMGRLGARWKDKIYPTDSVKVNDVCGAGDVFLSALVCRWLETNDMEKSIKTANKCASFSVTKQGTYQLSKDDYMKSCG